CAIVVPRSSAHARDSVVCAGSPCGGEPSHAPSSGCCATRTPPGSGPASSPRSCNRCWRCMPSASPPSTPPSCGVCRGSTTCSHSTATTCSAHPLLCQPRLTPTRDTVNVLRALLDAGVPATPPALGRAGEWLVDRQIFRAG